MLDIGLENLPSLEHARPYLHIMKYASSESFVPTSLRLTGMRGSERLQLMSVWRNYELCISLPEAIWNEAALEDSDENDGHMLKFFCFASAISFPAIVERSRVSSRKRQQTNTSKEETSFSSQRYPGFPKSCSRCWSPSCFPDACFFFSRPSASSETRVRACHK